MTKPHLQYNPFIFTLAFFLICVLSISFSLREYLFFRDHAIIWDGALRILNGEVIYLDFGAPVGPITFYLAASFLKVFNITSVAFHFAQLTQSFFMLILSMLIVQKLENNIRLTFWSGIVFAVFYLNLLWFPWYNTTAVLFLLLSIYLYLIGGNFFLFLSGISIGLSFLSKQDIGFLTFLIVFFMFFIDKWYFKNIKSYSYVLYMFLGVFIILFLFFLESNQTNFLYWFNLGQNEHQSRYLDILNIFKRPGIYIASLLFFLGAFQRNRNLVLYSSIIYAASVSTITSGLSETHFYYIFTIPAIIFNLRRVEHNKKLKIYINSLYFFGFLAILFPVGRQLFVIENLIINKPDHYAFNSRKISNENSIIDLGSCYKELSHIYSHRDLCVLKEFLEENFNKNANVLNLSELSYLNHFHNFTLMKGQPLWYHDGISFFSSEKKQLSNAISNGEFDLIILQESRIQDKNILSEIRESIFYREHKIFYNSPSNLTDSYKVQPFSDCGKFCIRIFLRNSIQL